MLTHETARSGSAAAADGVVTGDMVAQHAYCPRRLYLMYSDARWADNEHTEAGAWLHRNADRREDALLLPDDPDAPRVSRSVMLESATLGLRARLDLVERQDDQQIPIEIKRGRGPEGGGTHPPERLQVATQVLLLREHGHPADHGVIYYATTRTRVRVEVGDELRAEVLHVATMVRDVLGLDQPPPPLRDSPKCPGCSVAGICLPDETNLLTARGPHQEAPSEAARCERVQQVLVPPRKGDGEADNDADDEPIRRLAPPRDDALPLYIQEQGAQVGKRGETLVVTRRGETLADVRLLDVSQLVLCGSVSVTPAAVQLLCEAGVPILHLSMGHWFYGVTSGPTLRNAYDRAAQFGRAADRGFCLELARSFVTAKARNQRTLLRRNGPSEATVLEHMRIAIDDLPSISSQEALLGAEGNLAALYFGAFGTMLRPREEAGELANFTFSLRNRRPPKDPVNAMLSFGYALLAKEATVALLAAGLDPWWGLYHRPRHGRPSLALDLMEEFRPLIVDSTVITAVNTGAVDAGGFIVTPSGCTMTPVGRKAFLRAYEARMDQLITHPVFGYRLSWRRTLAVQALLLARVLRGSIPTYPSITTR